MVTGVYGEVSWGLWVIFIFVPQLTRQHCCKEQNFGLVKVSGGISGLVKGSYIIYILYALLCGSGNYLRRWVLLTSCLKVVFNM